MQAVFRDTAPESSSPWVMPGKYTVKLTAAGKTYSQPMLVVMDPRVHTSMPDLTAQFKTSQQVYDNLTVSSLAAEQLRSLRAQIKKARERTQAQSAAASALSEMDEKLAALGGAGVACPGPACCARSRYAQFREWNTDSSTARLTGGRCCAHYSNDRRRRGSSPSARSTTRPLG